MREFTDITIVLDRSGSMQVIKEGTLTGINNFIKEQRETPGEGCWTLVDFDDPGSAAMRKETFPRTVMAQVSQEQVGLVTSAMYQPYGDTALIDAVCITIDATGQRLAAMKEADRPNRIVFVIQTDGQENRSTRFKKEDLAARIATQEKEYNWKFIFLGANMDAKEVGTGYAIPTFRSQSYAHTNVGTRAVLGCASKGLKAWKAESANDELYLAPLEPEGSELPGKNP